MPDKKEIIPAMKVEIVKQPEKEKEYNPYEDKDDDGYIDLHITDTEIDEIEVE